jgi:Cleft lip and palate transmembrane protein 1 (CLPTM1)
LSHVETELNPTSANFDHKKVVVSSAPLIKYLPRIKTVKKKKLISKYDVPEEPLTTEVEDTTIISYFWPRASLELVAMV